MPKTLAGAGALVRFVSPAGGSVKDVPVDAEQLAPAGWFRFGYVGPSTARPTVGMFNGMRFYDTTLSKAIIWVGDGGGIVHHNADNANGFWTDGTGNKV